MKDSVRKILTDAWKKDKYYDAETIVDDRLLEEMLQEATTVYEGEHDEHRWISYFERVVEIDGHYLSFNDAMVTGDMSKWDQGWEFSECNITEVEPYETTVIRYREVKDG